MEENLQPASRLTLDTLLTTKKMLTVPSLPDNISVSEARSVAVMAFQQWIKENVSKEFQLKLSAQKKQRASADVVGQIMGKEMLMKVRLQVT